MKFRGLLTQQLRCIHSGVTSLTSKEVATALRPFIFSIHPDRFWRHPKEKNINEASLKKLNEFLESNRNRNPCENETVTFYMRNSNNTQEQNYSSLRAIKIKLNSSENVNITVHNILSQCSLSTDYLSKIGKLPRKSASSSSAKGNQNNIFGNFNRRHGNEFFYGDGWDDEFINHIIKNNQQQQKEPKAIKLVEWLHDNYDKSRENSLASRPIKNELDRLHNELMKQLNLKGLSWNCDWGASHMRGCLKNLSTLAAQYPNDMLKLKNRILVFGRQSGVGCDGEIVLNIEDVRSNWLDLIRSVKITNPYVNSLQASQAMLSDLLNGIRIVRPERKIQLAQHYYEQIQRFTATIQEYLCNDYFPDKWPESLSNYRLTVDSYAGPLMLTNDGSFNIPASCPANLALRYIIDNLHTAKQRLDSEENNRNEASKIIKQCIEKFGLRMIDADENITPEQMCDFGRRLLQNHDNIGSSLVDANLRVSMYYSVLDDGQLCVPFNFT